MVSPRKTSKTQPRQQPSDFELQILGALWEHGPMTVRQVMGHLTDGKERAYTSVLSVMQVMHKKGMLKTKSKREGLAHVYQPCQTRDKVATPMLRGLVTRVFGGRTSDVVQRLLSDGEVAADEIAHLRAMLDDLEKKNSSKKQKG